MAEGQALGAATIRSQQKEAVPANKAANDMPVRGKYQGCSVFWKSGEQST